MTEDEAKTKWCPFARVACYGMGRTDLMFGHNRFVEAGGQGEGTNSQSNPPMARCIGSACMAWRWDNGADFRLSADAAFKRTGERIKPTHGYCGLAGRPE